jgi:hypothetical protein
MGAASERGNSMQQMAATSRTDGEATRVRKRFRQSETVVPFAQRTTCTVEEAIRAVPISRSKLYDLIRKGVVKKIKIGAMTRIIIRSLPGFGA